MIFHSLFCYSRNRVNLRHSERLRINRKGYLYMTKLFKFVRPMDLHLFDGAASGGDGTAGSASSGNTATSGTNADNAQSAQGENNNGQVANASTSENVITTDEDKARTDFLNYIRGEGKQFYDENVQNIINKRFKELKTMEAERNALSPMIDSLKNFYGIEGNDFDALREAVLNDERMYEDKARENGVSVKVQMKFDKMERENAKLKEAENAKIQQEKTQAILEKWETQSNELKEEFPEFDLDYEMESNSNFYDLLTHGLDVKTAYIASKPSEYAAKVAKETEKRVTDNIRANGLRPNESGGSSATATSSFDVTKLTAAQRRDLANRAMQGERIQF